MTEVNIFEQAARKKLRFQTVRGLIGVEEVWELPLTSKSGFSLNDLAKGINRELKDLDEEDFVDERPDPKRAGYALALDVVKHVIAVKQTENAVAADAQKKAEEKRKLLELLANKQDEKLGSMSEEQIKARLAELAA